MTTPARVAMRDRSHARYARRLTLARDRAAARRGSSAARRQLVRRVGQVQRPGLAQLGFAAEAPQHADVAHAVVARAFDVHAPVADHPALLRRDARSGAALRRSAGPCG